ncbi:hypothetical protein C1H46_029033 [Malus baccata]|uniref:Uncharacterized protein n=1 Tax=Malus baccata TaxID=106549 RepID=A0A540LG01_MALBA|nr:hypothetical protein C1H46_029033 [Malus baccata]
MESEQSSQPKKSRRVWKQHDEDALLSILEEATCIVGYLDKLFLIETNLQLYIL